MATDVKKIVLKLESREAKGKGAVGRLRKENLVPGVVYSSASETELIQVREKALSEATSSGIPIVSVNLPDGREIISAVKEVQYDPRTDRPIHVDFQEVGADEIITVSVTVETVGESAGVKMGGILEVHRREIEVKGSPSNIPEHVFVDVSALEIGDSVRLGEIELPEKVEPAEENMQISILTIVPPAKVEEETEGLEGIEGEEGAEGAEEGQTEAAAEDKA